MFCKPCTVHAQRYVHVCVCGPSKQTLVTAYDLTISKIDSLAWSCYVLLEFAESLHKSVEHCAFLIWETLIHLNSIHIYIFFKNI